MAFYGLGIPGILLALILPFIIRKPRVAVARAASAMPPTAALGAMAALHEVFAWRSFLLLAIAASFTAFLAYG